MAGCFRPNMAASRTLELTPDLLLRAYAAGLFPMAESATDPRIFWVDPTERGIFPLALGAHVIGRRQEHLTGWFDPREVLKIEFDRFGWF